MKKILSILMLALVVSTVSVSCSKDSKSNDSDSKEKSIGKSQTPEQQLVGLLNDYTAKIKAAKTQQEVENLVAELQTKGESLAMKVTDNGKKEVPADVEAAMNNMTKAIEDKAKELGLYPGSDNDELGAQPEVVEPEPDSDIDF